MAYSVPTSLFFSSTAERCVQHCSFQTNTGADRELLSFLAGATLKKGNSCIVNALKVDISLALYNCGHLKCCVLGAHD